MRGHARASTAGTGDSEAGDEPPLRLRGDELDLYAEFHFKLIGIVSSEVRASREDVEDACAFAWVQFLRVQPDRDQAWNGWLVTVAKREAWKLNARHLETQATVGEDELEFGTTLEPADPRDRLETALEFHAAMEELRQLPERLRAIVFMKSQVHKHQDVADVLGISRQRVARLLQNAGAMINERAVRRTEASRPVASPRAAKLRELEDNPPEWLVKTIGEAPARTKSSSAAILAWRRAAPRSRSTISGASRRNLATSRTRARAPARGRSAGDRDARSREEAATTRSGPRHRPLSWRGRISAATPY